MRVNLSEFVAQNTSMFLCKKYLDISVCSLDMEWFEKASKLSMAYILEK